MSNANAATARLQSVVIPMAIVAGLFFIFGFITWLNGALVPFLQTLCQLTAFQAMLVASAFYIAYVVMALPMASIIERTGYKNGMSLGLFIAGGGSLIVIPAAYTLSFPVFLLAQFVIGSGLTILQTASNPYVVKLGPPESAAVRVSVMGTLNKGAGIAAPIVFTALVLSGIDGISEAELAALSESARDEKLSNLALQLIAPYIGMAIALAILGVAMFYAPIPDIEDEHIEGQDDGKIRMTGVFQYPSLVLGALALFCYVGVEVIAGDAIGLLGKQAGLPSSITSSLTSLTMAFMVIGYVLGMVLIPRFISQQSALMVSAIMGLVFTVCVITGSMDVSVASGEVATFFDIPVAVFFVALLGLANAMCWPTIWPLALHGLGKYTSKGAALLIMGIAGGAIFPAIYGHFADTGDGQLAFAVSLPAYLYILFYAVKGHKLKRWKD